MVSYLMRSIDWRYLMAIIFGIDGFGLGIWLSFVCVCFLSLDLFREAFESWQLFSLISKENISIDYLVLFLSL